MPLPVSPEALSPLIAACVVGAGLFIGAIVRGWLSGKKAAPEHQSDAMVISGEFTDGKLIKALTQSINDMAEQTARFDKNQGVRSADLRDAMDEMARVQRAGNAVLAEIRDLVTRGVRIAPAPPE